MAINFHACLMMFLINFTLPAAIIGTNVPSQSVTMERIATVSSRQRPAWQNYLKISEQQLHRDRTMFATEIGTPTTKTPTAPPATRNTRGIDLDRAPEWYATLAALRVADNLVTFQTPAGGWSKNLDMTQHPRAPGEMYASGNLSRFSSPADLDQPHDVTWNYVGTFDNGATITQLRFLAKVISVSDKKRSAPYRASFERGLKYIFAAQFPNGGWPQVWPLQGGYHDGITFNDGAMVSILDLLADVVFSKTNFNFVPAQLRHKAATRLAFGTDCVLATQIIVAGNRTAWGQQYNCLTMLPCSARNYEMPSISSGESAGVMLFLMRLPNPDARIIAAVHACADWFTVAALRNKSFQRTGNDGRHLIDLPGHEPIWSRYYDLSSSLPIFGDRDKTIHDSVEEISQERRDGYAWFNTAPSAALERYKSWKSEVE